MSGLVEWLEEKVIAACVLGFLTSLFTKLTVHACKQIRSPELRYSKLMVEMTFLFSAKGRLSLSKSFCREFRIGGKFA